MAGPAVRRVYKNPPIEEALVEFRFTPGQEWDPTIPGKLHDRLKDAYPGKPRQQKHVQAAISSTEGQPTTLAVNEGVGRVQLIDAEERRLVSLGPDVISVNALRPYEGWEQFRPRMQRALRQYVGVTRADMIRRIGVRYVNRVVIPAVGFDLAQYFRSGPPVPSGLPSKLRGFLSRAEHEYDDGVKLLMMFASIDSGPDVSEFLLDLDVVWESGSGIGVDDALAKTEDLHEREGRAFEAVITDTTREVLDA